MSWRTDTDNPLFVETVRDGRLVAECLNLDYAKKIALLPELLRSARDLLEAYRADYDALLESSTIRRDLSTAEPADRKFLERMRFRIEAHETIIDAMGVIE